MTMRSAVLAICVTMLAVGAISAQPVELANDAMVLRFDPDDGYALSSLVNVAHGVDFIQPRPEGVEQNRSPWAIEVRAPNRQKLLTAADAARASHELDGDTLTITWSGVQSDEMPGDLTVIATVRLPKTATKAWWRLEVSGEISGWLWEVDFPRVFGIRDFPDAWMSLPWYWGRLVRKPMQLGRAASLEYPEPASMQWFAYWGVEDDREPELATEEGRDTESGWSPDYSDAAGLYWGAEDGEVHFKRFAWDCTHEGEQLSWRIENIPPLHEWPMPRLDLPIEVRYQMPYEAVTAVFTGDWLDAARIYREWADDQQWAVRGPMDDWPAAIPEPGSQEMIHYTPEWFREIGFWGKFYHEPAKVLPEWAAYRRWTRVPMASHWYRYNVATFNDNDPEHLPPDPYLLDAVRAARELGVEPMPYVLATIWDTDTQSWIRERALRSAIKSEDGEITPWEIGNNTFAWMCPATDQWRAKMREICEKLIWEHGMSGVYLDVLAAGSAKPCYDPDHGHSIRGGNYYGQGVRRLMHDLRQHIRRLDPDACFFSEEIGEHLIDLMDGFLTLDLTRSYTPGGEQVWPIFTGAYGPCTLNFGSDASLQMRPDRFAQLYGTQLIWGSQPLHSDMAPPRPEEGDTASLIFREYTRAYHVAGKPFLTGGEMLRLAVRPREAPEGACGLEMAVDAHTVRYENARDRRKIWTGPAVLASAWRRFGDIAIVMANITGDSRTVDLTVRPEQLGLSRDAEMVRLWPGDPQSVGEPEGEHALTLEPWQCAVYVLTVDTETAIARLNPLAKTPWELQMVRPGESKELSPVTGAQGSLYAWSDGPVLNEPVEGGVRATAVRLTDDGRVEPAVGLQAEVTGSQKEGHGLPRDLDRQPFALLRELPHAMDLPEQGVLVLSGDENHMLVAMPPGAGEIRFAGEGLVIAVAGDNQVVVRGLEEGPADRFVNPGEGSAVVAWARFDAEEVNGMLEGIAPEFRAEIQPFADRLIGIASAMPTARESELAEASREFVEVAQALSETPGALSPVSPLTRLHERLSALVTAQTGMRIDLTADHRWLAPELEKRLRLRVMGGRPQSVDLTAIGFWRPGNLAIAQPGIPEAVGDTLVYHPSVRMDDGLYVERVIPVIAQAHVSRAGLQWVLSSILRLEANRPYQVIRARDPVTITAGQARNVSFTVRNWSPIDLTLRVAASGPEGWEVAPMAERIEAPALADTAFEVTVHPPESAPRGRAKVRVITNHASGQDSSFISLLSVSVLDRLKPLREEVEEWTRPGRESRARIRQSSKFAIYAEAGDVIHARIENVRVTRYVDPLRWTLLMPDMSVAESGSVGVDESAIIDYTTQARGTHYLEIMPGQGSADVTIEQRTVAEVATREDPLRLFCSEITRYFYVPEGSKSFRLGALDGGPTEGARFVITSPSGRVALDSDGNYNGVEMPVQVQTGEDGKVWSIRIEPRQDISLWLAGDVAPYLSTAPERVLRSTAGQ